MLTLAESIASTRFVRRQANLGFRVYAQRRVKRLGRLDPIATQESTLLGLVRQAARTKFGIDHRFDSIKTVGDFQNSVPLRTYEDLWNEYLASRYPTFDNLTWPGRIPYLALTSGTTQGATKYIPVSNEMIASNEKAARTLAAYHINASHQSRLFEGKLFFLGGSSDLEQPAKGVEQGDLSGIAAKRLKPFLRPYAFPPLKIALEPSWDRKLTLLAEQSLNERISLVGGVPSWLLILFQRLLEISGKSTIAEVWPHLELAVHGGVKFDPYRDAFKTILGSDTVRLQESYPCSEGFIAFGDPASGHLRLCYDHGLFYEFVPIDELDRERPTRHWLQNVETGVHYAIVVSTCAGLWSHIIGDTVRFESKAPPLLTFTGRTKYSLSAFGEHLISEEVEGAIAEAATKQGASVRDWHVGPIFEGELGHHCYVVEFLNEPANLDDFRTSLDWELSSRNADYLAHRAEGVGLPLPAIVVARPGALDDWLRSKGKLGGQHKFPRMDNSGALTQELLKFLDQNDRIAFRLDPASS